jgi:hypothetical protein
MQRPSPGSDWVFGQLQLRSRAGRLSGINRGSRQGWGLLLATGGYLRWPESETFLGHHWLL